MRYRQSRRWPELASCFGKKSFLSSTGKLTKHANDRSSHRRLTSLRSREFELRLEQIPNYPDRIRETNRTSLFLFNLAPEDVACIRKIKIRMDIASGIGKHCPRLDLDKDAAVLPRVQARMATAEHMYFRDGIQKDLRGWVNSLPVVEGKKYLTMQDVYKIRGLVEKQLQEDDSSDDDSDDDSE